MQHNFVVLNTGQPTFHNNRGHYSHINLTIVSSSLGTKCTWHTLNNTMGSDHMPVITEIDEPLCIETSMLPKWKLDAADWRKYQDECKSHIHENSVYDDNIQSLLTM